MSTAAHLRMEVKFLGARVVITPSPGLNQTICEEINSVLDVGFDLFIVGGGMCRYKLTLQSKLGGIHKNKRQVYMFILNFIGEE